MNILVLCPHYAPDLAPTGTVMTAIGEELAAAGHSLHIVTALPWYQNHRIQPGWGGRPWRTERTAWGRITRVHPFPTDKSNIPARALGFAGFTGLAGVLAALSPTRPDVVLAMSPPLPIGVAGLLVARIRRVPFVFNIQDVFPDVAIDLGLLTNPRVIRLAAWLERFTYRHADAVTVLSNDLRDNVEAKLAKRGRRWPLLAGRQRSVVEVIPNFVDARRITPSPPNNAYRAEFGLTDKTVVLYAGNVGLSQSLDLVIDAARRLAERDDVAFVINGGGAARPALEATVAADGLTHVHFVDYQPHERLPEVLAAGDIHVVPLRRGLAKASVPSKLYSILAAGRPVLASVDAGTEVVVTLERADAGIAVAPEDPDAFFAALEALLDDPAERARLGTNGRRFVENWITAAAVAQAYAALFERLRPVRRRD
jgi:colanic acid biosynthesis glycosyl transferase WcaI